MLNVFSKIFGTRNDREVKNYRKKAEAITALESKYKNLSDEELKNEYQRSILTVLPSTDKAEAFGLVLTESMACGTPVIASDLPGVRTIVDDERFVCKVNDINSIKESIERMLDIYEKNKNEYSNIQRKYLNDVRGKYNWGNIVNIFK